MQYRYAGPGPVPDPEGEIVHPGDEREFAEAPNWGPWEPVEEPETPGTGQQSDAGLAPAQAAADGGQPSVPPLTALPVTSKEM